MPPLLLELVFDRIEKGPMPLLVRPVGRRNEAIDGLADQPFQFWIVIGAAIGGEDALMLALARRRVRHGTVGLGRRARQRRAGGLEASDTAGGQSERRAQHGRRNPKPAFPSRVPSHYPCHVSHSFLRSVLFA